MRKGPVHASGTDWASFGGKSTGSGSVAQASQLTRLSAQLKLAVSMNLRLDNELIAQVVKLGNFKSKRDAVDAAVAEFVARRNRLRMLDLEGQIDFDPNWNYKHMRRRC